MMWETMNDRINDNCVTVGNMVFIGTKTHLVPISQELERMQAHEGGRTPNNRNILDLQIMATRYLKMWWYMIEKGYAVHSIKEIRKILNEANRQSKKLYHGRINPIMTICLSVEIDRSKEYMHEDMYQCNIKVRSTS